MNYLAASALDAPEFYHLAHLVSFDCVLLATCHLGMKASLISKIAVPGCSEKLACVFRKYDVKAFFIKLLALIKYKRCLVCLKTKLNHKVPVELFTEFPGTTAPSPTSKRWGAGRGSTPTFNNTELPAASYSRRSQPSRSTRFTTPPSGLVQG